MNNETTFYIYNENGIIPEPKLSGFCDTFLEKTSIDFDVFEKDDIDQASTIFKKFSSAILNFTIYDFGYVMKVEGDIKQAIQVLLELDAIIDKGVSFFVSPSQRVENADVNQYPRNADLVKAAKFLDAQFRNNEYTSSLK